MEGQGQGNQGQGNQGQGNRVSKQFYFVAILFAFVIIFLMRPITREMSITCKSGQVKTAKVTDGIILEWTGIGASISIETKDGTTGKASVSEVPNHEAKLLTQLKDIDFKVKLLQSLERQCEETT